MLSHCNGIRLLQPDGVDPVHDKKVDYNYTAVGMLWKLDWYYIHWEADWPCINNQGILDKGVASLVITILNWTSQ